jgi:hypothetical protein
MPVIGLLKLQLAIESFSMAQHETLDCIKSGWRAPTLWYRSLRKTVNTVLVYFLQKLLCQHFDLDRRLIGYLSTCKSVRDDFHHPFHFTVYETPVDQIHPVTGSIIYPRCLKRMGDISFLSLNRTSVWQQSLQGILRLVACLCPFDQGLVLRWKTQICMLLSVSYWIMEFSPPCRDSVMICRLLCFVTAAAVNSDTVHFHWARGAPEFVRLPAFSLVACTVGLPGSPPFHFIIFHAWCFSLLIYTLNIPSAFWWP